MSNYAITNPYPVILNQIGGGLNGGKVYIGLPDQDPETYPAQIFWDEEGAIPASQPLPTIGGYITRSGSPAQVFGAANYSIRVRDRFGVQIFYAPNVNGQISDFINSLSASSGAGLIGWIQQLSSSVFRWVSDRLTDSVSVYDFMTKAEATATRNDPNSVDLTAKLQAAFDSGANLRTSMLKRATFRITGPLIAKSTSQQINWGRSTLHLDDPSGLLSHIDVGDDTVRANDLWLKNFVFTRQQVATAGAAIRARYTGLLRVTGNRVYGNDKIFNAISVSRAIKLLIERNIFEDMAGNALDFVGTGSGTDRTVQVEIYDNEFTGVNGDGIRTRDWCEGFYIRGNIFYDIGGADVSLAASSNAVGTFSYKLWFNDFDTSGSGLYVQNVRNITVSSNWFSNNTGRNALFDTGCEGVLFNDNQVYGSTADSIEFRGDDLVATGNLLSGGANGILFAATTDGATLSGNTFKGMSNFGINQIAGPANITIGVNRFSACASGPISGGTSIPTIASADPLPVPQNDNYFVVSGNTGWGNMNGGYKGREITIIFTGTPTLVNSLGGATTMDLGGSNFVAANNNKITFKHNGVRWVEMYRKL